MDAEFARWNKILNCSTPGIKCAICRNALFVDCVRCQQGVVQNDTFCDLILLDCSNIYHKHCFARWHAREDSCPICNANSPKEVKYKEYSRTRIYLEILKSDEHLDFKKIVREKLEWNKETHVDWPKEVKDTILTLFLIQKRKEMHWLSKLVCHEIAKHVAKLSI